MERLPKTCCPEASRPFWILLRTKRVQLVGLLLLLLVVVVVLLELMLQASKRHPSPHRNTMLLKDGTTSKNMLLPGLTSLLDSGKNKASAAAGPAAAAPAAAAGGAARAGAAGLQNAPLRQTETPCY